MSRDVEGVGDGTQTAPGKAPDRLGDAESELAIPDKPRVLPRAKLPVVSADPELLRYRHRLDHQLAVWRNSRSSTSLATTLAALGAPQPPRSRSHAPLLWIAPIAACAAAGLVGWWVASAPLTRTGAELAETRQALQQEQDKVQKLGAALATTWREMGDRAAALADEAAVKEEERAALQQALQQSEAAAATFAQSLARERDALQQARQQSEAAASFARSLAQERDALQRANQQSEATAASFARSLAQERDALQQARQQSETAAASFAQSLAQERDVFQQARQQSEAAAASFAQSLAEERNRSQQLEQQLATRRDPVPAPTPPAVEPASDNPRPDAADPDLLRLMSRASLLVAQGDIGAARIVLERAAESGSASALFALAETFDPAVLSAWGTMGTQGDAARAGALYAKALAGGVAAAKERLATLRR
jgi:hypothetical protein